MNNSEKKIILKIKDVIFKHAGKSNYNFFLFGSRANKTAKERSDYDIGVIGKQKLERGIKNKIEEDFENIPAIIDFIDFYETDNNFKKIATKNIFWLKK